MKVVMVEDDEYKAEQIKMFILNLDNRNEVTINRSYRTGVDAILGGEWDLVLLDMTIPSYENNSSRNRDFGGKDIIEEMFRNEVFIPTVVVTQYTEFKDGETSLDELDEELQDEYPEIYRGYVFYNASILNWQDNLIEKFELIAEEK